jgi:hypothetical protein
MTSASTSTSISNGVWLLFEGDLDYTTEWKMTKVDTIENIVDFAFIQLGGDYTKDEIVDGFLNPSSDILIHHHNVMMVIPFKPSEPLSSRPISAPGITERGLHGHYIIHEMGEEECFYYEFNNPVSMNRKIEELMEQNKMIDQDDGEGEAELHIKVYHIMPERFCEMDVSRTTTKVESKKRLLTSKGKEETKPKKKVQKKDEDDYEEKEEDEIDVSKLTPEEVINLYHRSQLKLGWPRVVASQTSAHIMWKPHKLICPTGRWELFVRTERYSAHGDSFAKGCDNAIRYRWLPGYGLEIGTAC